MFRRLTILAFAALAIAMAAGQSSHDPDSGAENTASKAFAKLREDWAQDLREKKLDACVAAYDDAAEFLQPDGGRVRGAAEIRKLYQTITSTFDSDLIFDSRRVETSGDLAYDSGEFREVLTVRSTGKRLFSTGSYLTVYRRSQNGAWLIEEQMWTGPGPDQMVKLDLNAHPVVALTFDDLPAAGALPVDATRTDIAMKLASELNANRLGGTYGFVNAVKLEGSADGRQALKAWIAAGMNIGSHTWSHMSLTANSAEAFEDEVAKNEPALAEYAGARDWHWFRYPFLWEGDTLEKRRAVRAYLAQRGYKVAQVSLDFEDYAWNDAYSRCEAKKDEAAIDWLKRSYLDTAKAYIQLGREEELIAFGHEIPNVMLLHATAFTTLMLPDLLGQLRSDGFEFEALPEVEKDQAYSMDPDAALKYGGTLPDQFMDSRHLKYPPVPLKPFGKLKTLCE
ncbi:MAG TPA: polysaccharide deacetylase family protein [Terracidiphilus sp.]|jgi:peptidoglycan/xylan/chitin deacetylase (PgdA/CDA1 family)|nr:polysaccharide deacetylase family protein [Terracidiphilus sp.]